jgi:hypothetical protein
MLAKPKKQVGHSVYLRFAKSTLTRHFTARRILNPSIRAALVCLFLTVPAFAQKLVDPTTVAPEYRDAAEKRRAEQLKQQECAHKALVEKVMPRERTAFLLQCLEVDARK